MRSSMILVWSLASLLSLAAVGCNNTNNNANGLTTPESFVNQLVSDAKNGKIDPAYRDSTLAKKDSAQAGYFVIWDSKDQTYLAVNLAAYSSGTLNQGVVDFIVKDSQSPSSAGVIVTADGTNANGDPQYISSNGTIYSINGQTKDVDLQLADSEQEQRLESAAQVSKTYQMDFQAAVQLVTLNDEINALSSSGLNDQDRKAVTNALVGIAGLSAGELDQAIAEGSRGNLAPANQLIEKAAKNLGMPSSAMLRDRIFGSSN